MLAYALADLRCLGISHFALPGPGDSVQTLSHACASRQALAVCIDQCVHMYGRQGPHRLSRRLYVLEGLLNVALSSDGRWLAGTGNQSYLSASWVHVLHARTGEAVVNLSPGDFGAGSSPFLVRRVTWSCRDPSQLHIESRVSEDTSSTSRRESCSVLVSTVQF